MGATFTGVRMLTRKPTSTPTRVMQGAEVWQCGCGRKARGWEAGKDISWERINNPIQEFTEEKHRVNIHLKT